MKINRVSVDLYLCFHLKTHFDMTRTKNKKTKKKGGKKWGGKSEKNDFFMKTGPWMVHLPENPQYQKQFTIFTNSANFEDGELPWMSHQKR